MINEYLDDAYPEPALRPGDAAGRARMREWTVYVAEDPTWAVKVPSFQRNIRPELAGKYSQAEIDVIAAKMPSRETAARWAKAMRDGFSSAEIDASMRRLGKTLARMEAQLEKTSWLAGEAYTLADVDMAPFVHRIRALDAGLLAARPRVSDWYARIRGREAFRQAVPT